MTALTDARRAEFVEDVRELLELRVHPEVICNRLHVTLAAAEKRLRAAAPDLARQFAQVDRALKKRAS